LSGRIRYRGRPASRKPPRVLRHSDENEAPPVAASSNPTSHELQRLLDPIKIARERWGSSGARTPAFKVEGRDCTSRSCSPVRIRIRARARGASFRRQVRRNKVTRRQDDERGDIRRQTRRSRPRLLARADQIVPAEAGTVAAAHCIAGSLRGDACGELRHCAGKIAGRARSVPGAELIRRLPAVNSTNDRHISKASPTQRCRVTGCMGLTGRKTCSRIFGRYSATLVGNLEQKFRRSAAAPKESMV